MPSAHRPGTILPSGEPTHTGGLSISFSSRAHLHNVEHPAMAESLQECYDLRPRSCAQLAAAIPMSRNRRGRSNDATRTNCVRDCCSVRVGGSAAIVLSPRKGWPRCPAPDYAPGVLSRFCGAGHVVADHVRIDRTESDSLPAHHADCHSGKVRLRGCANGTTDANAETRGSGSIDDEQSDCSDRYCGGYAE